MIQTLSNTIVRLVDRFLPEPFVFALVMTFLTISLALGLTPASPVAVLTAWGDGLAMLLAFMTQMALMVLFAFGLSRLHPLPALLRRFASLPRRPATAYASATVLTGAVALLSWPLGLILGSLYARELGMTARDRGLKLHYPLIAASAFGGFVVWHMGYSASAPLFVATEGNAMQAQIGGLIPVSQTIFAPFNLIAAGTTLAVVAITAALLHPKDPARIQESELTAEPEPSRPARDQLTRFSERIEHSRIPTLLGGLLTATLVVHWFATRGLDLDLNIVNWTFLALGLLLARSSVEYANAVYTGARAAAPILLQYPFYGGIMGIMLGTGLVTSIVPWFTRVATEHTLPLLAFALGGVINFFIPSGGAQWAVQGPAFVEAAQALGTDLSLVVMGVAYGDQWTNIIHPFTVITVCILTQLKARQIVGYSAIMFLTAGVPLGLGLYLASRLG
ncbi:MAG: TIGR00366 family protein [Pseudomonadota bacterium]